MCVTEKERDKGGRGELLDLQHTCMPIQPCWYMYNIIHCTHNIVQ